MSDHPLGSLIEDPALPQGHPLSGAVGVSASMPVYVEPTAGDCEDEFLKAVVASARQTIRGSTEFATVLAFNTAYRVDFEEAIIELRNARSLAEAILKDLGETP